MASTNKYLEKIQLYIIVSVFLFIFIEIFLVLKFRESIILTCVLISAMMILFALSFWFLVKVYFDKKMQIFIGEAKDILVNFSFSPERGGCLCQSDMSDYMELILKKVKYELGILKSILSGIPMPYLLVNSKEQVVLTNKFCLEMLDIDKPEEDCYGKTLSEVFYNDPGHDTVVGKSILCGKYFRDYEVTIKNHRGEERHVLANVFPLHDLDNKIIGGLCIYVDSTRRKKSEGKLKELASLDGLTGLNNKRYFSLLSALQFDKAKKMGVNFSISIVDIDYFKEINDKYGHRAGDEVLKQFSDIAKKSFRAKDIIGRIGGEEFAIAFSETDYSYAKRTMERFRKTIELHQVCFEESFIKITISCGVSSLSYETDTLDDILQKADEALYCAKRNGRNRVC